MAAYNNLASKLERAVRAFLILQGKANDTISFSANGDCFISNDSRSRSVLPNRTIVVPILSPVRTYRREVDAQLQIQHRGQSVEQPGEDNPEVRRKELDDLIGETISTMGIGDAQSMEALADAITAAGRWLAVPDATPQGIAIAANNADMAAFRVDEIKRSAPEHTRGHPDGDTTVWAEILHYDVRVSDATN